MTVEGAVTFVVVLEFAAAIVFTALCFREVRFLRSLRPLLPKDEELPLYDALLNRAIFLNAMGVYLISLTVVSAVGYQVAAVFPPIRAINGLLFLFILAGPVYLGRAMRRRPKIQRILEEDA